LTEAVFEVSLPDFLYSDSIHDMGSPFHRFGHFFILSSLEEGIYLAV
jgi:hypothetical protein